MVRKNTWIWIVIGGLVAAIVLLFLVVLGAGFYLYATHVDTETATREDAEREFEETRQRFAGQRPLLRMEAGEPVIAREERFAESESRPIESLHVLVWDRDADRLIRITVPRWLLRLGGSRFNLGGDSRVGDLRLTMEDLERAGPGLLLDHQEPDGERVLVWTQ
jgi:hypothetical protein